jgi:Ca2+-binding EF-hand superfamily protein
MEDVYRLLEDLSRLPQNRDDQLTFAFKVFDAGSQDGILDRDELHAVVDSATKTHRHAMKPPSLSSEHENDLTQRIVDAMIEDCGVGSVKSVSTKEPAVGLSMTQFKQIFTSN